MTTAESPLTDDERAQIAEAVYDAYRLGKYGATEYLPMWHELGVRPTKTVEVESACAAVESILADRETALRETIALEIEAAQTRFEVRSDWTHGHDDGLSRAARIVRRQA